MKLSGNSAATRQGAQRVGQSQGIPDIDKWLSQSDSNYKWALPSLDHTRCIR